MTSPTKPTYVLTCGVIDQIARAIRSMELADDRPVTLGVAPMDDVAVRHDDGKVGLTKDSPITIWGVQIKARDDVPTGHIRVVSLRAAPVDIQLTEAAR